MADVAGVLLSWFELELFLFASFDFVLTGISNTILLPAFGEEVTAFGLLMVILLFTPMLFVLLMLAPRERVDDGKDPSGGSSASDPVRLPVL